MTEKQDAYCHERAKGHNLTDSYINAYGANNMSRKTINEAACRLDNKDKIIARVKELKADTERRAALNREDLCTLLTDMIMADNVADYTRLKAMDQLSRIIGAYDDHKTIDVSANIVSGDDKSKALKAFIADMLGDDH